MQVIGDLPTQTGTHPFYTFHTFPCPPQVNGLTPQYSQGLARQKAPGLTESAVKQVGRYDRNHSQANWEKQACHADSTAARICAF